MTRARSGSDLTESAAAAPHASVEEPASQPPPPVRIPAYAQRLPHDFASWGPGHGASADSEGEDDEAPAHTLHAHRTLFDKPDVKAAWAGKSYRDMDLDAIEVCVCVTKPQTLLFCNALVLAMPRTPQGGCGWEG